MNKEEIKHFKALLRQGILRHKNILLDDKFQEELLNIIKDYEQQQLENKELRKQLKGIQETYCKSSQLNHRKSIEIFKMKHQQKEFIKYLENLLITKRQKANTVRAYERTVIPIQGILIKFKEIIGVENEK